MIVDLVDKSIDRCGGEFRIDEKLPRIKLDN